jgi:hypothetical protein
VLCFQAGPVVPLLFSHTSLTGPMFQALPGLEIYRRLFLEALRSPRHQYYLYSSVPRALEFDLIAHSLIDNFCAFREASAPFTIEGREPSSATAFTISARPS